MIEFQRNVRKTWKTSLINPNNGGQEIVKNVFFSPWRLCKCSKNNHAVKWLMGTSSSGGGNTHFKVETLFIRHFDTYMLFRLHHVNGAFFHRAPLLVIEVFSKEMLLEVSTVKASGRPFACTTGSYVLPKNPLATLDSSLIYWLFSKNKYG